MEVSIESLGEGITLRLLVIGASHRSLGDQEVVESSPFLNILICMAQEILLKWVQ